MNITRIQTSAVPPRWLVLIIETSEGICGRREPTPERLSHCVAAMANEAARYVAPFGRRQSRTTVET